MADGTSNRGPMKGAKSAVAEVTFPEGTGATGEITHASVDGKVYAVGKIECWACYRPITFVAGGTYWYKVGHGFECHDCTYPSLELPNYPRTKPVTEEATDE